VPGFVDLFKTTSNFYIARKTSYEKNAMRRLMNDIKKLEPSLYIQDLSIKLVARKITIKAST